MSLAKVLSCCVYDNPSPNIMLNIYSDIPCMFDYLADPVVHLLLLQSFMLRYFLKVPRLKMCEEARTVSNMAIAFDLLRTYSTRPRTNCN